MSAAGLGRMLSQAGRGVCGRAGPLPRAQRAALLARRDNNNTAPSWARALLSSGSALGGDGSPADGDGSRDPAVPPAAAKRTKQDPRARATIGSVGRKIQPRHLLVISETGESLGTMHRSEALRLMDERGLKLVLLSEHADPPVYRLMSGRQIHEEQMRLREKQKAKAGVVQVKELTLSSGIAARDLSTKLRQVQSWLERKHHVRLTLRSGRAGAVALDTALEQMVQQMEVTVGFVSPPKVTREGLAAMCVLRPPSAKELSQKKRGEDARSSVVPTAGPGLEPEQTDTAPPTEPPTS